LAQQYKICPICDTPSHRNASICSTCGATLTEIDVVADDNKVPGSGLEYDHRFGETDLSEKALRWKGGTLLLGSLLLIGILVCAALAFSLVARTNPAGFPSSYSTSFTLVPTHAEDSAGIVSNTPRATVFLPTVTPAPPSATFTNTPTELPTPSPCMQQVQEGDDLYALVFRCGHRHYVDILNQVVEINGLADPSRIQIGQMIEIPWPTPTPDPNQIATEEVNDGDGTSLQVALGEGDLVEEVTPQSGLSATPTETLQPGVTWHRVLKDENVIVIAYQYGVNVEVLSQLNPEIPFSQCDFSLDTGGPACTVLLLEGQLIRVPAPTPTPTLSPTPSGSETSTPTITPTFNAPSALSPENRTTFQRDELVTLRWVATGTLAPGQAYRVEVTDLTTGSYYSANTQELFFIIPEGWQGQDDQPHDFRWSVSVVNTGEPGNPVFTTQPRTFRWHSRGESNS
jgi:hypothetical protein